MLTVLQHLLAVDNDLQASAIQPARQSTCATVTSSQSQVTWDKLLHSNAFNYFHNCCMHRYNPAAHRHVRVVQGLINYDLMSALPDWKHARGRPLTTWIYQIRRDTGISVTDALKLAGDRSFWRQITTAGCYGWSHASGCVGLYGKSLDTSLHNSWPVVFEMQLTGIS